jgi:putative FmdB family regulatory protein
MPIYEFFCSDCNTLYSFFTSQIDTEKRPSCPKCGQADLERRPARFAALTRSSDSRPEESEDLFAGLDESRMEAVMAGLEHELGGLDEDNPDPRQLAKALRKIGGATGLELGPKMEEMLSKLEAGADPDSLEEEMGDLDDTDESIDDFFRMKKRAAALRKRPRVDEKLYFF